MPAPTHFPRWFTHLVSPLLLAAAFPCLVPSTASAAEPFLEKTDLFTAGEQGYHLYHIPGIAVTAKGTVLAWCEARRTWGDWDDIRILVRRSTDDGKTWSAPSQWPEVPGPKTKNPMSLHVKGVRPEDVTYNNPVMIADRDGTVHGVFCLEYMRCFSIQSTDDGQTWSTPVEITGVFDKFHETYPWKVLATGPDHGIQLRNGRLVVPVWLSTGTGGNGHRPSVSATLYSDDHGRSWQAGEIAMPCTEEWINPNETTAVELADGQVMLNSRSESKAHRRLISTSPDGATHWSTPRFDDALVEPICMASLVRYSTVESGGKNRLLFCNPNNLSRVDGEEIPGKTRDRKNMTVRVSYDEGKTWAVAKTLEPGWSMYSDIAVSPAGTILCFYGRGGNGSSFAGPKLTLARFNLEWLTDGNDHR